MNTMHGFAQTGTHDGWLINFSCLLSLEH